MRRLVLNQCTQAAVASSTSARLVRPWWNGESARMHSVLYRPMVVSASALS